MAEARIRVLGDIPLDALPVVAIIADLVTPGADRQETVELLDEHERLLEREHAVRERLLQAEDALPPLHARAQLAGIERLREIVVGAGAQTPDHALPAVLPREQDQARRDPTGPC